MYVPANKSWLPAELQIIVWHTAFTTPSAKVMKGVCIENVGSQHRWPRKQITTKADVHALIAMGRSLVDPCPHCEFSDDTGTGSYCGECRSRPVVVSSFYEVSYLGGCTSQCRERSPRQTYLKSLQRQTCSRCEHIYRHSEQYAEFIEEEGCCPACYTEIEMCGRPGGSSEGAL